MLLLPGAGGKGPGEYGQTSKRKDAKTEAVEELSPAETKSRIVALCLVMAVVIFFWMAFHQNGLTLTYFADEFTERTTEGLAAMPFNVWNLVAVIFIVYALFSIPESDSAKSKWSCCGVVAAAVAFIVWQYYRANGAAIDLDAPIYQQFNPFYVVALTPVSMAIFGALAKKGKEPSAPRKIAYGMLVAAVAFGVMMFASTGLNTPEAQEAARQAGLPETLVSPYWLISVYLILTFGELLLSPMGISFVSKVAPPKYKGMMMGCWFVATAIGNFLVQIGGHLWGGIPLWIVWGVFMVLCVISALFMFAMMKRLEAATK